MSEVSEIPHVEPAGFVEQKRPSFARRVIGRIGRVFGRPMGRWGHSKQENSPAGYLSPETLQRFEEQRKKEAKERHEKRKSEQGCAVRAIVSATAFASGESNIGAGKDEWADGFSILPTPEEYEDRFKQVDKGKKPVDILSQDLMALYASYAQKETPLGKALQKVHIKKFNGEDVEMLKKRIQANEQVMIFTPDADAKKSHICHVGYKNGKFFSFSDPKISKRKYQEVDLSKGNFVVFSVVPEGVTHLPSNVSYN